MSIALKDKHSPREPLARKQAAPGLRRVETDLSADLPLNESELQIVETYLAVIIQEMMAQAEALPDEVMEG